MHDVKQNYPGEQAAISENPEDLPANTAQILDAPVLLTQAEAARYLRCTPNRLRRAQSARRNRLKFLLAGRSPLYRLDDLLAWARAEAELKQGRRANRLAL